MNEKEVKEINQNALSTQVESAGARTTATTQNSDSEQIEIKVAYFLNETEIAYVKLKNYDIECNNYIARFRTTKNNYVCARHIKINKRLLEKLIENELVVIHNNVLYSAHQALKTKYKTNNDFLYEISQLKRYYLSNFTSYDACKSIETSEREYYNVCFKLSDYDNEIHILNTLLQQYIEATERVKIEEEEAKKRREIEQKEKEEKEKKIAEARELLKNEFENYDKKIKELEKQLEETREAYYKQLTEYREQNNRLKEILKHIDVDIVRNAVAELHKEEQENAIEQELRELELIDYEDDC